MGSRSFRSTRERLCVRAKGALSALDEMDITDRKIGNPEEELAFAPITEIFLTRAEFRKLVAEMISEKYRIGLRHDILDQRGKQQHGWLGIDCRLGSPAVAGQN